MIDADLLIQKLNLIAPLSTNLQTKLHSLVKVEAFPSKHFLVKEGSIAKKIYFIKEGFARAYYFTPDGKQHTTWFLGQGDIMISVYSFLTQKPSYENIQLLEPSIIQSITWQELQDLYKEFVEFNYIGRIVTEQYYIASERRDIMLRTTSPLERYHMLLAAYPSILQKTTLGNIASYLGIAQETLSRLRGK